MTDLMKPVVYLTDADGRIYAKFVVNRATTGSVEGECYEAVAWEDSSCTEVFKWSFVTDVYCKSDACIHWWFNGEDYDADSKSEDSNIDAYYHLCSQGGFMNHIRNMCFVWRAAEMLMLDGNDHDKWVIDNYREGKKYEDIIDKVLDGYLFSMGSEKIGEIDWGMTKSTES